MKKYVHLLLPLMVGATPSAFAAFDLTGIGYVQYGDAQSYSLPIACIQVNQAYNGCDFNVGSTPGLIKDLVVLATGSSGAPVNTNFAGMDNAYSTPTGVRGSNFFQTGGLDFPVGGAVEYPSADPGQVSAFTGDRSNSWDTTIGALNTFLQGDSPVFFFNNNQTKSDGTASESLAAWAQITLRDSLGNLISWTNPLTGLVEDAIFDFTNNNKPYNLVSQGGGGTFLGNVGGYTSDGSGPDGNTNDNTDYVLSGGAICVAGGPVPVPVPCGSPGASAPIDHNLGADHAAYAIIFPELNLLLAQLISAEMFDFVMSVDFRFGCDPLLFGTNKDAEICTGALSGHGKNLNNGYEQLFLARVSAVPPPPPPGVANPGSLALMAGGLLMLGGMLRRRGQQPAA